LPVLRADFSVVETYSYQDEAPLQASITAYGGEGDTIRMENLDAWRQQTSNTFELHMLPGGHFFINTSQSILLEMLSSRLETILAEVPS
jgi:medium-chain acyl-[acyl-carrier-protein] hydrolase